MAWNPARRAVVDAERGIPLASSLAEMIHPSAELRITEPMPLPILPTPLHHSRDQGLGGKFSLL